jgi:hypothetical protein
LRLNFSDIPNPEKTKSRQSKHIFNRHTILPLENEKRLGLSRKSRRIQPVVKPQNGGVFSYYLRFSV